MWGIRLNDVFGSTEIEGAEDRTGRQGGKGRENRTGGSPGA